MLHSFPRNKLQINVMRTESVHFVILAPEDTTGVAGPSTEKQLAAHVSAAAAERRRQRKRAHEFERIPGYCEKL